MSDEQRIEALEAEVKRLERKVRDLEEELHVINCEVCI